MKTLLLVLATLLTLFSQAQNSVELFRDDGFSGPSLHISSDWTYRSNPEQNDWISSIKIPTGWQVIIYEHEWLGESKLLSSSWSVPSTSDFWNDRISSIKVIRPVQAETHQFPVFTGSSAAVTVFKNDDFTGESKIVAEDWNLTFDHSDYSNWNDKVNAVRVPQGCSVRLYKHNDFWGSDFLDVASDWSSNDYPGWRNQVSSIRVYTNDKAAASGYFAGSVSTGIVVFTGDNFSGESRVVSTDWNLTFSNPDTRKWGNTISSIRIPQGWSIRVYKHTEYWGSDYLDLATDWKASDYSGWDNGISSIKILESGAPVANSAFQPPLSGYVKVYKGSNFDGEGLVIDQDMNFNFDNNKFYKWNDKINSIRVPAGWSIRIYKYSDFWGSDFLDIAGDWSSADSKGWIDQISSIKILVTPVGHSCFFANGITVFKSSECQGESKVISTNWNLNFDNADYSKWNDKVNALRVPEGWSVRIYKYNDYWGSDYLDVTGDWSSSDCPGWQNAISSIEIVHRPDRCP